MIPDAEVEERVEGDSGKVLSGKRTSSVVSVESPNRSGYVGGKTADPLKERRNDESNPVLSARQTISERSSDNRIRSYLAT